MGLCDRAIADDLVVRTGWGPLRVKVEVSVSVRGARVLYYIALSHSVGDRCMKRMNRLLVLFVNVEFQWRL
jgi:hypothetical protein